MKKSSADPVIVIDDEQDLLDIMMILLRKNGIAAKAFTEPPSIDVLVSLSPAVIFTDMLMKGTNGAQLCQRLKADPRTAQVPVILISAHRKQDLEEAAK